jgi:hypothetical protein
MKRITPFLAVACFVIGLGFLGCASVEPTTRTDAEGEMTHDGLRRVDRAAFARVWVKPGADLSRFDAILLAPPSFHYRAVRRSAGSMDREFEVPENRRDEFERIVSESFTRALSRSRHFAVASEPGPETLLIVTAIHDVVSNMPPRRSGRDRTYVSRIGEATIVLELRDSESNEVIARAAERRAVEPISGMVSTNSVRPTSEVRREAARWGSRLRSWLDSLREQSVTPG